MDRLPAVSDTKVSNKCIGTRLAKFRFKGEWIGYWLYQIQKYQVNVSGTNEYQYHHVSDTPKTCINPSLQAASKSFDGESSSPEPFCRAQLGYIFPFVLCKIHFTDFGLLPILIEKSFFSQIVYKDQYVRRL
ncbi:hypothetical protein AVEN_167258-1 [Araneus ventricosus]|uniref:Uncharacterized protein n=1 Tax=Araneus ventricosus TaxID=182803 RepID=A0A4Y2HG47_ARAVE|nr:hypothetical protein AVEN_167258-1 [Araneus ventricosus]